ncbi:MAG: hypothetical protein ABEL51_12600 [Salinibacter sp.]
MNQDKSSRFVILGCGHTGSTLISGIFKISGYGSIPPISGMFESRELNRLCNILIGRCRQPHLDLTIDSFLQVLESQSCGKWSLKDPLLPFVMPMVYQRMAFPCEVIFNFRHPGPTVAHLLEGRRQFRNDLTEEEAQASAEAEYINKNKAVLSFITNNNMNYLMVEYDDLLDGSIHGTLNKFVGEPLNYRFIDPGKRRSPRIEVSKQCDDLYQELKQMAERNQNDVEASYSSVVRSSQWIQTWKYIRYMYGKDYRKLLPKFIHDRLYAPARFRHIRPPYPGYSEES